MKIKNLRLVNFRAAADISLDFTDGINLFAGFNGAGKSTVLDAVSICLSWLLKRIEKDGGRGEAFPEVALRKEQNNGSLEIGLEWEDEVYNWSLAGTGRGVASEQKSDFTGLKELTEKIRESYKKNKSWPVVAYYRVNRNVGAIKPEVSKNQQNGNVAIYDDSLSSKIDYQSFFKWFREQDDIKNEVLVSSLSNNGTLKSDGYKKLEQSKVEAVTRVIESFVPEFNNFRVERLPYPRLLVDKDGVSFDLAELSDGEKNLIALIGDIARRFVTLYPDMENPLHGEGIILIDEIDLHLHPKWQRMVVPGLLSAFPNCQFFISTHSPQVISHVKAENIFLLHYDKENGMRYEKAKESYGMSVERVVEVLMDDESRPPEETEKLDRLFEFIERKKLDEAKKLIAEMKEYLSSDPEIIRAETLIRVEERKK